MIYRILVDKVMKRLERDQSLKHRRDGAIMNDELEQATEQPAIKLIDGWRVETTQILICITCMVDMGESGAMGPTINEHDKMLHLENYVIVHSDSCDYWTEHEDTVVEEALKRLVEQGKVEVIVEDGETKYRAI